MTQNDSLPTIYTNMSWKGFTKAVGRLPALIAKSTGGIQETKDEDFLHLEEQFKMLDILARKLSDDTRKFKDSLSLMLHHQAELARLFTAIYSPLGTTVSCLGWDARVKFWSFSISR